MTGETMLVPATIVFAVMLPRAVRLLNSAVPSELILNPVEPGV